MYSNRRNNFLAVSNKINLFKERTKILRNQQMHLKIILRSLIIYLIFLKTIKLISNI